jgi:hypothetical protein
MGTANRLFGSYAVIMVDPDIANAPTDSKTGQFLHWMQAGLESATTTSTIGGTTVFELKNVANTSAFATYAQPSPPNQKLTTHRYIQLLVNTTGNSSTIMKLMKAGATKTNFSALAVVNSAGVNVAFGNYFNVTNEVALAAGNATTGSNSSTNSPNATASARPKSTNGAVAVGGGSGAMVVGIGAFVAAFAML